MIKRIIYTSLLIIAVKFTKAQQSHIDSLVHEASITQNDTLKLVLFSKLSEAYTETNPDSAYYYAEKILQISRNLKLRLNEAYALGQIGYALLNLGNYPRSLQIFLSGIAIAEDPKSEKNILPDRYSRIEELINPPATAYKERLDNLARVFQFTGILYGNDNNHEKEIYYYLEAKKFTEQTGNIKLQAIINSTLGRAYLSLKKIDSAWLYEQNAYNLAVQSGYKRYLGSILLNLGRIQVARGNKNLAAERFKEAIRVSNEQNYLRGVVAGNLYLADLYTKSGQEDSVLHYTKEALQVAQHLNAPSLLLRSYRALSEYYKTAANNDSAVKYQSLIIKINDSLFNSKQAQQFQNIDFDEQQRQQQIEAAQATYRNKVRIYVLIAGLTIFLFIAIMLWRNSRHRQLANILLSRQKKELESTLDTLKATQKQLIQSEKMASLGELTAGIAHEIQNPLNFVNNFSEVNTELIDEMEQEIDKGNMNEAKAIAKDIKENEEKINYHGKRADAIVKGMLQHSRSSSGVKEPTDINALCDEYLRLSYHGLRAKDKSFNATMKTDFDNSIGNINIIPQDIGRVVLNLLTNAFYVVDEKKKSGVNNYEPTVSVSTKKIGDKVEIKVADNGNGIPQKVLDKIFQPFFTTKPTGQGTGLGLSLSYDIVKAHGGELKAETKEARPPARAGTDKNYPVGQGEGATFTIQLPFA